MSLNDFDYSKRAKNQLKSINVNNNFGLFLLAFDADPNRRKEIKRLSKGTLLEILYKVMMEHKGMPELRTKQDAVDELKLELKFEREKLKLVSEVISAKYQGGL